jgi:hypothetical protein
MYYGIFPFMYVSFESCGWNHIPAIFEINKVIMIHFWWTSLNYSSFLACNGVFWEISMSKKVSFQSILCQHSRLWNQPQKVWNMNTHTHTNHWLFILALLRALILHMPRRHQNCHPSMLLKAIEVVKKTSPFLPSPPPPKDSTTYYHEWPQSLWCILLHTMF